jgi:hypothetical protein
VAGGTDVNAKFVLLSGIDGDCVGPFDGQWRIPCDEIRTRSL